MNSLLDGAFQLAYVTRDIAAAAEEMTALVRLEPFTFHHIDIPCFGRNDNCVAKIAISWNGDRQFELIQPVSGAIELYAGALPPQGVSTAFHHVGIKIAGTAQDWEASRNALLNCGFRIALQGGLEGRVLFAYFDMRDMLGHYIELIWLGAPFLTPGDAAAPTA